MGRQFFEQAVGAYEAAALMGVHFTQARKMFLKGELQGHKCHSVHNDNPSRRTLIYDGRECEANYQDYLAKLVARGGKTERRPRENIARRLEVVRHLEAVTNPIAFDDAISLSDAKVIAGVHWTLVARYLRQGRILGRVALSMRGAQSKSRLWIVSRKSVMAESRTMRAREAAGSKPGTKRQK
jgi:hypothetical protein